MACFVVYLALLLTWSTITLRVVATHLPSKNGMPPRVKSTRILILGGGMAGVIAARTLKEQGFENFVIIEARDELGGRAMNRMFGKKGQYEIEEGANFIQGTETPGYRPNPVLELAKKHNLDRQPVDFGDITTYDFTGEVDYLDVVVEASSASNALMVSAGARISKQLVDLTSRAGYSLTGARPKTHWEKASEYYTFDFEEAQAPEQISWLANAWSYNFTYVPEQGGFSRDNLIVTDKRGYKAIIQEEADEFLHANHLMLNSTVRSISYSSTGVNVTLVDGRVVSGGYALCTFSIGVLQYGDVTFEPDLPGWKQEAIQTMSMPAFTKIFLQFEKKFWFDTQVGLYADLERGKYPVWTSLDTPDLYPGSGIIFATVTGDYSRRIEALTDEQVKAEMIAVLRSMFPHVNIPRPLDFYFPRWLSNPLFRGSYSLWPASFVPEHQDNIRAQLQGRLWFAGEHTSRKWFGYLHGSYFEGLNAGNAIAHCIKNGGCLGAQHHKEIRNTSPYKF